MSHVSQPVQRAGARAVAAEAPTVRQPRAKRVAPLLLGWRLLEERATAWTLFKACVAELLGTFVFVFIATGVVTSGCHTVDVVSDSGNGANTRLTNVQRGSCFLSNTSTVLNIALAFGFTIFVVIYFTASFSGGHINPAVSLGMFLTQRISFLRMVLYIAFQCGGAAIGSVVLKGVNRATGATVGTALGFEIILSFALVFTVFAATDSQRALSTAPLPILAPLSIGMVVFVCHLVAIPVDGTSINPARSFGPAVVAHQYTDFWIFWAGPFTGAIAGSILYELFFKTWGEEPRGDPAHPKRDLESGIPITSNVDVPLHAGTAGLEEVRFTEAGLSRHSPA